MPRSLYNKKIFILSILVFVVGAALLPAPASAVKSATGQGLNFALTDYLDPIVWILGIPYGILFALQSFGTWLLGGAAWLLDTVLDVNITSLPFDLPGVTIGWSTLRDVANAFFILIVLWIALTIVFNIEQWGGKKLLFRVIIVALLINFSLVFVNVVFAFTNEIAKQIYESGFPPDVSGFIIDHTKIHTINKSVTKKEVDDAKKEFEKLTNPQQSVSRGFTESLMASLGIISDAQATHAKCVKDGKTLPSILCFHSEFPDKPADRGIYQAMLTKIVEMSTNVFLLLIVVLVFLIGAVLLLVRIIAMAFIAILAPIALLFAIVPTGATRALWNQWLTSLFKWALVAPVFFFLFYISLLLLKEFDSAAVANSWLDINRAIGLWIVIGFMIAAAWISLKFSGKFGQMAVGAARTAGMFALGAATGGVAAAGAWGMRTPWAREKIQKAGDRLSERPILGKVTAPIMRRAERISEDRGMVEKHADEMKGMSTEMLTRETRRGGRGRRVAAGKELLRREKLTELEPQEQQTLTSLSSYYGMQKDFQEVRPDLFSENDGEIAKFARDEIKDFDKVDKATFDTAKAQAVIRGLITNKNISPGRFAQLVHEDAALAEKIIKAIEDKNEGIEKKLAANDMEAFGVTTPEEMNTLRARVKLFKESYGKYSTTPMSRSLNMPDRSEWWPQRPQQQPRQQQRQNAGEEIERRREEYEG